MQSFINTFNGRELAAVAWSLIFLTFIIFYGKTRKSVLDVIKAIVHPKMISVILAMLLNITFVIIFLRNIGLWNATLLKDSLFWVAGTAFVLFFNVNKASANPSLFKKIVIKIFAVAVFIEFVVNLYSFGFIVEFILLPVIFIIVGMSTLANMKEEYKIIRKPLNYLLGIYGFLLLSKSLSVVFTNPLSAFTLNNFLTFITPVLLTLLFIPFLYFLALFIAYETLFIRIDIWMKKNKLKKFVKIQIIRHNHFSLKKLNKFADHKNIRKFVGIKSKKEAMKVFQ